VGVPLPKLSSECREDVQLVSTLELLSRRQADGVVCERGHFLQQHKKRHIHTRAVSVGLWSFMKSEGELTYVNEEEDSLRRVGRRSTAVSLQLRLSLRQLLLDLVFQSRQRPLPIKREVDILTTEVEAR